MTLETLVVWIAVGALAGQAAHWFVPRLSVGPAQAAVARA